MQPVANRKQWPVQLQEKNGDADQNKISQGPDLLINRREKQLLFVCDAVLKAEAV